MLLATPSDLDFMEQALSLAKLSRPHPNPQVGAVIVKDGDVVGTGHHVAPGSPHAEIIALRQARDAARGAALYVTLEPCVHHGRTGPCVEAILDAGISTVVVGMVDPDPRVNGRGIERLREAGVTVKTGVQGDACRELLKGYTTHRTLGRPHLTLKAAITLDGYLAGSTGDSKWISSVESRVIAHEMRAACDAVLVGVGTVVADNPLLTVRHVEGKSPLRIVLDSKLRTPLNADILTRTENAPTMIVHSSDHVEREQRLFAMPGVETMRCTPTPTGRVDIENFVTKLGERGILSVLVEGGREVLSAFLESGLSDDLVLFIAPRILGAGLGWTAYPNAATIREGLTLAPPRISLAGGDVVYRTTLTARDNDP